MEIMGRGFRQIMLESPGYFYIGLKYFGYKFFNKKSPIYGSADIINVCNLHCTHCYWWLNRKENEELTVEQWKKIIDEKFKKNHIFIVTLVGGEPTMRMDVVKLFVKEFPKRACVVSNGTFPLEKIKNLYFYWISIDGTQQVHDSIRGKGAYEKTKKNIMDLGADTCLQCELQRFGRAFNSTALIILCLEQNFLDFNPMKPKTC